MKGKSLILVGGPDSGKSNYLARFWLAVQSQQFDLVATTTPDDLSYIEDIAAHLLQGKFVPRSDQVEKSREFQGSVTSKKGDLQANIIVPDMHGEIWHKAVSTLEIPQKWLTAIKRSTAAVLFVRVASENNVDPLNWVTTQGLLKAGLGSEKDHEIPTQIALLELLRFIDENISRPKTGKPKVAVMVTAWDMLHQEEANEGPEGYLQRQFPMFAGRLSDIDSLDVKIFGCSIVGGDLLVQDFVDAFLNGDIDQSGYIIELDPQQAIIENKDLTRPINWLLE